MVHICVTFVISYFIFELVSKQCTSITVISHSIIVKVSTFIFNPYSDITKPKPSHLRSKKLNRLCFTMHQIEADKIRLCQRVTPMPLFLTLIPGQGVVSLTLLHFNRVFIVRAIFRYRDALTLLFLSLFKQVPARRQRWREALNS